MIDADEQIRRTLTEQARRHAKALRDMSKSTRILVRALDNEIERLTRLVGQARPFVEEAKERTDFESLCPACGRYWEADASNCADDCARKAWIAEAKDGGS